MVGFKVCALGRMCFDDCGAECCVNKMALFVICIILISLMCDKEGVVVLGFFGWERICRDASGCTCGGC